MTSFLRGAPLPKKNPGSAPEGREIYSRWELGADGVKKLDKSNRVFARYKFHQKVQQEGESFEQFLTDLKLLVKDCGYGDPDKMVRDRVVIRCHASKTREKLIQECSHLITGASRRLDPVIKCCLFLSFFQSLVSRAPLSAVTKSLS